jgi:hypothetical protein
VQVRAGAIAEVPQKGKLRAAFARCARASVTTGRRAEAVTAIKSIFSCSMYLNEITISEYNYFYIQPEAEAECSLKS